VYTVPLYTTLNSPGARLNVDPATNLPVQNGVAANVPFTAIVPCSLVSPVPLAGRAVVYGHGLLGSGENELSTADNLRALADTYGLVLIATDWQGMASEDTLSIVSFLGDLSGFPVLPERLHQGILNHLVLARLVGAPDGLSSHPAFFGGDELGPLLDPSAVYFYGNSMGGVYGVTFMALAQEVTRGVIGVGAANFSTLLQRSRAFGPYSDAARTAYPNDLDRMLGYPVVQELWDRVDPNGWYHHVVADPLPGTPPHAVLLHLSTNDAAVPNLGTEILARSLGIPQVMPAVQTRYGIPEAPAPIDGSALLESNGGYAAPPLTNRPPLADNPAHEAMRALPAVQAQIDAFLRPDGMVKQFCTGPCDPE
jgi:pimeloyl-ACP methyl ester carboxylesterase